MSENFKLYKLIILYMLKRVDFPLTTSQISEFVLDEGYTTYFKLQQSIAELLAAGLIREETTHNRTFYQLTADGAETIQFFKNEISPAIQQDINVFLSAKKYDLKSETAIKSDYYKNDHNEFTVRLQIIEANTALVDLSLSVPSEQEAEIIAANWDKNNEEVYRFLMTKLL